MSDSPWSIRLTRRADKDVDRLDSKIRERVVTALDRLAAGDPRADVRRLKGTDELRLRVGDWRVRLRRDPEEREIVVLRVLPRGGAYRDR